MSKPRRGFLKLCSAGWSKKSKSVIVGMLFLQLLTKHTELCQIRLWRACLAEFYESL